MVLAERHQFDFDDSFQGHLRFDNLVETEVFLGIENSETDHWIEDFSCGSSGIEFNSSASVQREWSLSSKLFFPYLSTKLLSSTPILYTHNIANLNPATVPKNAYVAHSTPTGTNCTSTEPGLRNNKCVTAAP
ncbi:unnamed protein product [Prunus brigantina]